jgi:hypothetical protein
MRFDNLAISPTVVCLVGVVVGRVVEEYQVPAKTVFNQWEVPSGFFIHENALINSNVPDYVNDTYHTYHWVNIYFSDLMA